MADFIGLVDVKIYFGTKYDDLNIPFWTDSIRQEATKTLVKNGQVVWQTTWLATIDINIENYQDIVGAQYLEIYDAGTLNHGFHWFTVIGYHQVSRKTVQLGIMYDALLSVNVGHITGISGILKRWTVDDDSHFNYVSSSEPINQIDDYNYSYFRYSPVNYSSQWLPIVGFPYDMRIPPDILQYTNSDGTLTQIFYPKLTNLSSLQQTVFSSSLEPGTTLRGGFSDGMGYFKWSENNVRENYSLAVGLGHELANQSYILPSSDLVNITDIGNGLLGMIQGNKVTISSGMSLVDDAYNNNKSGELGIYFTLYNELTGDSNTVENKDLDNVNIDVMCNPYPTGCFYARLNSNFHDVSGLSGLIKSVGYRSFSLASRLGLNQSTNFMNNVISTDAMLLDSKNQEMQVNTGFYNQMSMNIAGLMENAVGTVASAATLNLSGAIDSSFGIAKSVLGQVNNQMTYNDTIEVINNTRMQQRNALSVNGSFGQIVPPLFKMGNVNDIELSGYTFVLRKSTLSARDRARADRFFTAYGYNVDNTILDSPNQLNVRDRFTFIMADDINITSVTSGTDLTRLRDFNTVNQIRQRFSSGLRIWQIEPDYDFTKYNAIK